MQKYILLFLVIILIANCNPDPQPPEPDNPDYQEDIEGVIFKIRDNNDTCGFILVTSKDGIVFPQLTRNLPDSLKFDYQQVKVTYERSLDITSCILNHPELNLGQDSIDFRIIDIMKAVPL